MEFINENYRLYLGDCLDVMDRLIKEGIIVDAIICDPPYQITSCEWDKIIPFDEMWKRLNKLIKDNGAIVLFGCEPFSSALRMNNIKNYKYDWIWEKSRNSNPSLAKTQPLRHYENILIFSKDGNKVVYYPQMEEGEEYATRKGAGGKFAGNKVNKTEQKVEKRKGRYPKNVIRFKSCYPNSIVHPTQKPIDLMEYLIKTYTLEGELVLDFTMGSGTTGVACVNTNRKFIGIELEENYFNIAKERIEEKLKM